jgi:predicted P-loop ATPase
MTTEKMHGAVNVLTAVDGSLLTKRMSRTDGELRCGNYDKAYLFISDEVPVQTIHDLARLLPYLSTAKQSCIIRGAKMPGSPDPCRRLFRRNGDEGPFFEDVPRSWMCIDIDDLPLPDGLDPMTEPVRVLKEIIEQYLPSELHDVTFIYQWSSSAGVRGWDKIKVHLWFYLESPCDCAQLKRWSSANGLDQVIDTSLFQPVQIHFTANPVFEGMDDPVLTRCSLVPMGKDTAALVIPVPETRRANQGAGLNTQGEGALKEAADLISKHWPPEGTGHHHALTALAGALASADWDEEHIRDFLKRAVPERATPRRDEIDDAVSHTFEMRKNGEATTGWPTLVNFFGNQLVEKFREMLPGDWRRKLLKNRSGNPTGALANASLFIAHLDCGKLAYNQRSLGVVWTQPPPWASSSRPLMEADAVEMARWLAEKERVPFKESVLMAAMVTEAHRHPFDPVVEYLEKLEWDGEERLDTWLIDFFGAPDEEYTRCVGAAWAISAVARAFHPGCKADHVLVLEGYQGVRKSQSLAALGGEYYMELGLDPRSKDTLLDIHGPWLIEWGELSGIAHRDIESMKTFLSRPVDRFRPPYGRFSSDHPRSCVFAGTTNNSSYLIDPTGNRRFWPVHVSKCNPAALADSRDQLWAEAVHRYRNGENWWLDEQTEHLAAEQQKSRLVGDAWEEAILSALQSGKLKNTNFVSTSELYEVLELSTSEQTTTNARRIANIMERVGWEKCRGSKGTGKRHGYKRPGTIRLENNGKVLPMPTTIERLKAGTR